MYENHRQRILQQYVTKQHWKSHKNSYSGKITEKNIAAKKHPHRLKFFFNAVETFTNRKTPIKIPETGKTLLGEKLS